MMMMMMMLMMMMITIMIIISINIREGNPQNENVVNKLVSICMFVCYLHIYGVGSDTPMLEPLTSDVFAPCWAKQHKHFMQYSLLWLLSWVFPEGHALGSTSGRQI